MEKALWVDFGALASIKQRPTNIANPQAAKKITERSVKKSVATNQQSMAEELFAHRVEPGTCCDESTETIGLLDCRMQNTTSMQGFPDTDLLLVAMIPTDWMRKSY